MKTTTEFEEWFGYFDPTEIEMLYHMYMAVKDGKSYEPFCVEVEGEKMIISCSTNKEIRLLIASNKAKGCFLDQLNKQCGGDVEFKYELTR